VELSCTGPGLSYPDDVSKSISITLSQPWAEV
jgi:hypothetical protein